MAEPYRFNRWHVISEDSVSSTQRWLRERVTALPDRTVIIAGSQSSGRGRSGSRWESPVGGLYSSLLLKPSPPVSLAPCVSLLAALVLSRLLKEQEIEAVVKWPNDVIADGRKIAGIISEAGSFPESWFILGIGVNISETPSVPGRVFLPAGSWGEFGNAPRAEELLGKILNGIDSIWSDREKSPISSVLDELNSILWRKNESVTLTGGNDTFHGTVDRIAPDGSLVLLTDNGERHFNSGELTTVPEERR